MILTVLKLRVGDLLADPAGAIGKVVGFGVDCVIVEFDDGKWRYKEEELRGLVMVEGVR